MKFLFSVHFHRELKQCLKNNKREFVKNIKSIFKNKFLLFIGLLKIILKIFNNDYHGLAVIQRKIGSLFLTIFLPRI